MAKKKPFKRKPSGGASASGGRSATLVRVRKVAGEEAWEFVHPRSALDRAADMEEVHKMIAADELEIATDEIRWLLNGCSDFMEAHKTLGELALLENDLKLARGHFGYAFQIGTKALEKANCRGSVPYKITANQAFHEAGKGLAYCLKQLDKPKMLRGVVDTLLRCDRTDPLGVRGFLADGPQ